MGKICQKRQIGGESGLYDKLTAEENIAYFGQLNDMDARGLKRRINELTEIFGMQEYLKRRALKLSKGMKQKVAFARSIVHNPDVMLFDEPTAGLDVTAVREVHRFILDCSDGILGCVCCGGACFRCFAFQQGEGAVQELTVTQTNACMPRFIWRLNDSIIVILP